MLLIVGSILIAFALDAWWDERAELRQEKAQLRALRAELVESRDRLLEVIESVRHHAANVDRLVTLLEAAGDATVQVPNELLGSVVSWRTSDIALSSLESLRASGLLGRLSNPELQAALAGFPAQVEDIQEYEIGLTCVAAAIRDYTGIANYAISVSGPHSRMTEEVRSRIGQTLVEFTGELSRRIGY